MKIALIAHDKKKNELLEITKNIKKYSENMNSFLPVQPAP